MAGSVLEIEEDDFGTEGEEDSTPVVVIEPNQTSVVVQAQDLVVEVPSDEVEVISVAKQGPQGPPGVDGGSFTVAYSYDMPTYASVGMLVWQRDTSRLVVWNGDFWSEVADRREDEVLFHDYPISGAVWDDFTFLPNNEVLDGSAAIITRIEAYALTGGTTLLSATTRETGYSDRVPLIMNLEWPGLTTVSIDLWLPTDNLQVGSVLDPIVSSEPTLSGSDFSITVLGRWL